MILNLYFIFVIMFFCIVFYKDKKRDREVVVEVEMGFGGNDESLDEMVFEYDDL